MKLEGELIELIEILMLEHPREGIFYSLEIE